MRLTNSMRAAIVRTAVGKAYNEIFDLSIKQVQKAVKTCYETLYEAELALINSIPEPMRSQVFYESGRTIGIVIKGVKQEQYLANNERSTDDFNPGSKYRFGEHRTYYGNTKVDFTPLLETHPELVEELKKALLTNEKIAMDRKAFKTQLEQLVNSVTTVAKLVELAPELAPFVPEGAVAATKALLPADMLTSVRAVLSSINESK